MRLSESLALAHIAISKLCGKAAWVTMWSDGGKGMSEWPASMNTQRVTLVAVRLATNPAPDTITVGFVLTSVVVPLM